MKLTSTIVEFRSMKIRNTNDWLADQETPKYVPLKCDLGSFNRQWTHSTYKSGDEDLVRHFISACNGRHRLWKLASVEIRDGLLDFCFVNPKTRDKHGICQETHIIFSGTLPEFSIEPDTDGDSEPVIFRIQYNGNRGKEERIIAEIAEVKNGKNYTIEKVIRKNDKYYLETFTIR